MSRTDPHFQRLDDGHLAVAERAINATIQARRAAGAPLDTPQAARAYATAALDALGPASDSSISPRERP